MAENLSRGILNTIRILAIPSRTSRSEKNIFIARTAITSSVAALSKCEYQSQMPGIKKCHIPNPIEIILPIVVRIFTIEIFDNLSVLICTNFSFTFFSLLIFEVAVYKITTNAVSE